MITLGVGESFEVLFSCSIASGEEDLDAIGLGLFGGGSAALTFFDLPCHARLAILVHNSYVWTVPLQILALDYFEWCGFWANVNARSELIRN